MNIHILLVVLALLSAIAAAANVALGRVNLIGLCLAFYLGSLLVA